MADRTGPAAERALRRELQELTKKREALNNPKRRGSRTLSKGVAGRRSVFDRLGGEPTCTGTNPLDQCKENNRRGKRDNDDNRQSASFKRQRLHSAVTKPDGSNDLERTESNGTGTEIVSPSATSARAQERKLRAVAPYAQQDGIARSKRMFGALMGHLGKAKRQIEKDSTLFKRQDTKQHEAEQKEKMQSQYLENQARLEAEVTRLEAAITRTELDRSEEVARSKLEHLQTVRKSENQSKFLLTTASPPIYYLPAKHTKETKELVAASMEAHEAKMKASVQTNAEIVRKREAEYMTKLEALRDELETIQKEKSACEQAANLKKDDGMEDEEEDMNHGRKESERNEKGEQEHGEDIVLHGSHRDSRMEGEDEETIQNTMVDSEASDNALETKDDAKEEKDTVMDISDMKEEMQTTNDPSTGQSNSSEQTVEQEQQELATSEPSDEVVDKQSQDVELDGAAAGLVEEPNGTETNSPARSPVKSTAYVTKMKVAELRAELRKRGLETKGLKAILVQRLQQAILDDPTFMNQYFIALNFTRVKEAKERQDCHDGIRISVCKSR